MPSPHEREDEAALEEEILELVRTETSDDEREAIFLQLLARSELTTPSAHLRDEFLEQARLAIQIANGSLTLGQYLTRLRISAKLSRQDLGSMASLSGELIGELEADQAPLKSIDPSRLARIAARIGAVRRALITLAAIALKIQPERGVLRPRLTRLDGQSSPLESERAFRHSLDAASKRRVDDEDYLDRLANAFDEETARKDQL